MGELELKPCPFCGGTEQRVKSSGRWGWFVSCRCCAVGPSATSKDEAIAAWNNRADDERYIEALDRVAGKWALDELNRADGRRAHVEAENSELRELIGDMHALLQRCCDETDCGETGMGECFGQPSRCVMWSDPSDDCDLRKIEERMRYFGIEVLE